MHDVSTTNKYSNKQQRLWLEYLLLIMEILSLHLRCSLHRATASDFIRATHCFISHRFLTHTKWNIKIQKHRIPLNIDCESQNKKTVNPHRLFVWAKSKENWLKLSCIKQYSLQICIYPKRFNKEDCKSFLLQASSMIGILRIPSHSSMKA